MLMKLKKNLSSERMTDLVGMLQKFWGADNDKKQELRKLTSCWWRWGVRVSR